MPTYFNTYGTITTGTGTWSSAYYAPIWSNSANVSMSYYSYPPKKMGPPHQVDTLMCNCNDCQGK